MKKFSSFILKHRVAVLVIFILLLIPSIMGSLFTKTNYDIVSYMPGDLNSREGEKLLEEEFKVSGQGLIALKEKELWKIEKLINELENVEGVDRIVWLSDISDIRVPLSFINEEIRDSFFSGEYTVLQVHFKENSRSLSTSEAIKDIREIIGEEVLFGGEPVIMEDLQSITSKEKNLYLVVAVISIYLILSLSITSFIEPLLFLISVGFAVALNMGTNYFLGEVSFITASVASVMQLGISMDYSIFLLHRFEEEKQKNDNVVEAMISAVSKTSVAILSSALTTVAGFLALMVMKNGIGRDLGIVLGKGIVFSLIVTIILLPCLILIFSKISDRFRHKPVFPTFKKASDWIVKGRWVFLIIIIVISIPSFLASRNVKYYYTTENYLPDTARSISETNKIKEMFGVEETLYVITRDEGNVRESMLVEKIKGIDEVESIISLSENVGMTIPNSFIPDEVKDNFINTNYRYFSVNLSTSAEDIRTFNAIDNIKEYSNEIFDEYYITGHAALIKELADLVDVDSRNVAIFSIGLIALVLCISFFSLSLPVILILVIELAIWINLSIPYFQGNSLSSITPVIIGAIQLGATVDYAILFASRYKENITLFESRIHAMKQTIKETGPAILTSALTMLSATLGIALLTSIKTAGELTMLIGRGAIISMIVILLGLPPILLCFDRIIGWTTIKWGKVTEKKGDNHEKERVLQS